MHKYNPPTKYMPGDPACPSCGIPYEDPFFDIHEGRACCPGCRTLYLVPRSYQPFCPDEFLEFGPLTPSQADALDQFREAIAVIAEVAARATNGSSYELYARTFTDICEPYMNGLDPALREHAIIIASHHGYIAAADDGSEDCVDPDVCPFTGIAEHHCPCNRHP